MLLKTTRADGSPYVRSSNGLACSKTKCQGSLSAGHFWNIWNKYLISCALGWCFVRTHAKEVFSTTLMDDDETLTIWSTVLYTWLGTLINEFIGSYKYILPDIINCFYILI